MKRPLVKRRGVDEILSTVLRLSGKRDEGGHEMRVAVGPVFGVQPGTIKQWQFRGQIPLDQLAGLCERHGWSLNYLVWADGPEYLDSHLVDLRVRAQRWSPAKTRVVESLDSHPELLRLLAESSEDEDLQRALLSVCALPRTQMLALGVLAGAGRTPAAQVEG